MRKTRDVNLWLPHICCAHAHIHRMHVHMHTHKHRVVQLQVHYSDFFLRLETEVQENDLSWMTCLQNHHMEPAGPIYPHQDCLHRTPESLEHRKW